MVEEARPSIPSTGKKRLSHRSRQMSLQVVVGTVILICGVVIGFGMAVLLYKQKIVPPPGPLPPIGAIVNDMQARYDLTPEQTEKVEAAFGKRRETLRTLFEEFRSKSEAEYQALSAEIKQIFTPEQYERWEQDFRRRRRPGPRWERGRPGERGPGRRGPEDRGPGRRFGQRGPGGRGPGGRGFGDRERDPREFGVPEPNAAGPGIPEPNAAGRDVPEPNAPSDP